MGGVFRFLLNFFFELVIQYPQLFFCIIEGHVLNSYLFPTQFCTTFLGQFKCRPSLSELAGVDRPG
jgi:hypothetical protein